MPADTLLPSTARRLGPVAAAALLWLAAPAQAHDTWFAVQTTPGSGERRLALGTGAQFPLHETPIGTEYLRRHGCLQAGAGPQALAAEGYSAQALIAQAPPTGAGPATCWAQSTPFDLELPPAKVAEYLAEVRASPAQRAHWAALQARGLPWRERYTKHARIELPGTSPGPVVGPGAVMDLDVTLEAADTPPQVGDPLSFQVLRDGLPLAGLDVELRGERLPVGLWLRTDAEGRVRVRAPAAGAWLLRGIDLRPSASEPDHWESRFVTLAFSVAPRPVGSGGDDRHDMRAVVSETMQGTAMLTLRK